jgi:dienelactone hydrolase
VLSVHFSRRYVLLAVAGAAGVAYAMAAEQRAARVGLNPSHAQLWDITAVRQHPLDVETVGTARRAPLIVPLREDWMHRGDAWVAPAPVANGRLAQNVGATDEELIVEEFYLTAGVTAEGPNRIYCAIARPAKATAPVPAVLIFHGGGGHASGALALVAARRHPGMAGVAMDYNGQFAPGGGPHVTRWKIPPPSRTLALVPDLRNSGMYHYVTAARRTIDFLETQSWADVDRIGCVGISAGGWVALILAGVDDRVKCVTTGVSAGGMSGTAGKGAQKLRAEPASQRPLWLANYEPMAYAAGTTAAVFFQLASNDSWFWITGAARHLAALRGPKGWVVRPNSNHGAGGPEISDLAAPAFMRQALVGGPSLPSVVDFQASSNGDVYTWKVDHARGVRRTALYWSMGCVGSSARYWMEISAKRSGDRWIARVPERFAGFAAEAFVNVLDTDGVAITGPLLSREGTDPRITPVATWEGGSWWDRERGLAAWRTPGGWLPKTEFALTPTGGLILQPASGGNAFCGLTNSVILASGSAARHRGVRVRIDGGGHGGVLKLSLLRDTMSMDESASTLEIPYEAGVVTRDIPWSEFKSDAAGPGSTPWPFDGLKLEGVRPNGAPLSIEEIAFIP